MPILPDSIRKNHILIALGVLAILAFAWYIRIVFLYIALAAILAMITRPLERWLERRRIGRKKIPRSIRALLILLSIYVVIFSFVATFIPLAIDEAKIISGINSQQISAALHEPLSKIDSAYAQTQQPGVPHKSIEQTVTEGATSLLNFTQVSEFANSIAFALSKIVVGFFAVSFFTFFLIKDGPVIFEMLLLLVPVRHVKSVRHIFTDAQVMLTKYFSGVFIDVIFVATFVSSGMAILGIRNAIIIGLFAGVMNMIPYVGTLIAGAFAIIIGISTNLQLEFYSQLLPLVGKIVLVFVLMNLTDAFLVQPYIFSNRVKAHPLEIFTVILVAGALAGVGGMIAAVPVYTVFRIIAREFLSKYKFIRKLTDEMEEATGAVEKNPAPPDDSL